MEYHVRYADQSDIGVIGEIHSQSFRAAYRSIIPDSVLEGFTAEECRKKILISFDEGGAYAVISDVNKPFGFLCFGKCRDEDLNRTFGEIRGLYLLPEYWNQGAGAKLLNWGIGELIKDQFDNFSLWVLEGNLPARRFYEKSGFRHDGTVKVIYIGKELKEYRYIKYFDLLNKIVRNGRTFC